MKSGIYCIRNLINGKVYVGSTTSLKKRQYKHWWKLKNGSHDCPILQHSWKKHGEKAFAFAVLEECSPEELLEREDWWIDHFQARDRERGYNLGSAVRGRTGLKNSAEQNAKISAANSGKSPSSETRAKMAAAKIGGQNAAGHKLSDEWKAAHSARMKGSVPPNKGKPMSDAAKAKLSASKTGKPMHSEEHKAKLAQRMRESWTPEKRAEMSARMKGNSFADRAKLSAAMQGNCKGVRRKEAVF